MSISQWFAGFALVALLTSSLAAQDFQDIEPIPAPAADAPEDELPPLNIPTPAGDVDLQPIPEEDKPLTIAPAVEQATYESVVEEDVTPTIQSSSPVVEGPFSESTALEPIADQSSSQPIILDSPSTLASENVSSPVEYPSQSLEYQQQPIQLPPSQTSVAPSNVVVTQPAPSPPIVVQSPRPQVSSQPQWTQQQAVVSQQAVSRQAVSSRSQAVRQPVVVQQPQQLQPVQQPPTRYYRVQTSRQPAERVMRQAPQTPQQVKVVIRQTPDGRMYAVPASNPNRPAQFRQPAQAVRPVAYNQFGNVATQVQVIETTQYRPVQVRVTETYRSQPRTVVVPATVYVPGQPFRNAARRRMVEYGY